MSRVCSFFCKGLHFFNNMPFKGDGSDSSLTREKQRLVGMIFADFFCASFWIRVYMQRPTEDIELQLAVLALSLKCLALVVHSTIQTVKNQYLNHYK